ncbi:hypothetical protein BD626DRAFT_472580 [Schizophyllum amplum]|uniref:Uncharacterized protein n=1 Tax=Schizophyllum amplum TaxID=97359 RepID=A0A550CW53_9AGAR|nr:hypothetical protein BD626DRAFT_472580 [Auriculariopsis ampla]
MLIIRPAKIGPSSGHLRILPFTVRASSESHRMNRRVTGRSRAQGRFSHTLHSIALSLKERPSMHKSYFICCCYCSRSSSLPPVWTLRSEMRPRIPSITRQSRPRGCGPQHASRFSYAIDVRGGHAHQACRCPPVVHTTHKASLSSSLTFSPIFIFISPRLRAPTLYDLPRRPTR